MVMMPYMAVQVLNVSSSGTGILLTAAGCGAVIPTVMFARAGIKNRRMGICIGSFMAGFAIIGFAFTSYQFQSFSLALVFVFIIVLSSSIYMLSAISSIQLNVPHEFRGRIMGIYTITYSIVSLGGLYSGLVGGYVDRLLDIEHSFIIFMLLTKHIFISECPIISTLQVVLDYNFMLNFSSRIILYTYFSVFSDSSYFL